MDQDERKNAPEQEEPAEHMESDAPSPQPLPSTDAPPSPQNISTPVAKAVGVQILLRPIHLIVAAVCALAVIAGGIALGMQIHKWTVDPDIDPDAEKYPYPGVTDTAEGQIAVPGYSTVSFPADSKEAHILLPNPEGNPCYFVFSIVLTETGEEIYRSGMVPPGMALTEITLSRPLSTGTYSIDIRIETFSLENKTPMNGANVKATLEVS